MTTTLVSAESLLKQMADALHRLEVSANTVAGCYTRNPGRFAEALKTLADDAAATRPLQAAYAALGKQREGKAEADAWLISCRKGGTRMQYATVDENDSSHWADSLGNPHNWIEVIKQPLYLHPAPAELNRLREALAYAVDNPEFDSEKFDALARAALTGEPT